MKKYTLITGASEGIGKVFAEAFAKRGDNLILVARTRSKLEQISQELSRKYKIDAIAIPLDLSAHGAAKALFDSCQGKEVKTLVNNAGFGFLGAFADQSLESVSKMISLNITVLTELAHLFLPQIKASKGSVLNVASTAAFQPIPFFAVYAATKAYVLHFSEALHEELRPAGVTVLALCPGPTETNFFEAAEVKNSANKFKMVMETPEQVVEVALRALDSRKAFVVSGWKNKATALSGRFAPRGVVAKIAKRMMGH
jgi:short-subunit dehydrogenase